MIILTSLVVKFPQRGFTTTVLWGVSAFREIRVFKNKVFSRMLSSWSNFYAIMTYSGPLININYSVNKI